MPLMASGKLVIVWYFHFALTIYSARKSEITSTSTVYSLTTEASSFTLDYDWYLIAPTIILDHIASMIAHNILHLHSEGAHPITRENAYNKLEARHPQTSQSPPYLDLIYTS